MNTPNNPELDLQTAGSLTRQWDGTATEADERAIAEWKAAHPGDADLHDVLREAWDAPARIQHTANTTRLRARVHSALHEERAATETRKSSQYFPLANRMRKWRLGAAVF